MNAPRRLLLIIKEHHLPARETGRRMAEWLERRGVRTRTVSSPGPDDLREAGGDGDAALVLGGDGAMLGAARALRGLPVPLLGVNFGRVGFLTEIPGDNWEPSLIRLLEGEYQERTYAALAWSVSRADGQDVPPLSGWAVNDVVAARGTVARAVSLDLSADGVFLSRLRCDGVIVSAPLGATAYAASARGPLAHPSLEVQLVTPICPFAGAFPPLVLPAASEIRIVAGESGGDAHLTVDGQESMALFPGDALTVRGVPGQVRLLVGDPRWYWRRLVERGFILPGPGSHTPRS